ncbi:copper amine oxidase, partial [Clostridium perfringens]
MKKNFMTGAVSGLVVGALLFGGIPTFAAAVKSIMGAKVTGVYTVEQGGQKIAEAAVINGSTYAPVRAIAEATGT